MTERIWDSYLTEQDRRHIERHPAGTVGFGDRPALLLIDLYRSVFGDERLPLLESAERYPTSCGPAAWDALPKIEGLLAAAREAAIPIIHTTYLRETGGAAWCRKSWPFAGGPATSDAPAVPVAAPSEDDDPFMEGVEPRPDELIIHKSAASCFWGTPLVGHLIGLGVDTVIVGGESTSGCVRAAVVEGNEFRFRMIVVEDCVFDRHQATHAMNLFDMDRKYADVLGADEVCDWLGASASRALAQA